MSATINDLASFNKFFTENQHRFIRFAWTYTRDEVVAEDIVMESLMAYWENRDHMTPEINPAAYVLTVVKNKCLNYLRHKIRPVNTILNICTISQYPWAVLAAPIVMLSNMRLVNLKITHQLFGQPDGIVHCLFPVS